MTTTPLQALVSLSDFKRGLNPAQLNQLAREAPDPETMIRQVFGQLTSESDVLRRKWRKALTELWTKYHPDIPLLPQLPLTRDQISESYQLLDAVKFIQAVTHNPARLIRQGRDVMLDPDEALRIAQTLPSLESTLPTAIETEWALPQVRRLRAILESARLIRPYKGQLVPVRSRLSRFMDLTSVQQFFTIWHADVYHVNWALFAPAWQPYVAIIQDYLPLLWEVAQPARAHAAASRRAWCQRCIQAFLPLWDEAGLISPHPRSFAVTLLRQHALPVILNKVVLQDVFARYGLIGFTSSGDLVWTELGEVLMKAERSGDLPCASHLLN